MSGALWALAEQFGPVYATLECARCAAEGGGPCPNCQGISRDAVTG